MNTKSLLVLVLLAVLGIASYTLVSQQNSVNRSAAIGQVLLADVIAQVNVIDRINITAANNQTRVTLVKQGTTWQVEQRDFYPADMSKIRSLVMSLLEAKILEEKTSNPELYARLGVEDMSHADAQGMLVTLYYAGQTTNLIIGNPGPQLNKNRYVRKPEEATTWLVDRKIDVKHELTHWLNKSLFSVEPDQIAQIAITVGDSRSMIITHDTQSNAAVDSSGFIVTNLSKPEAQVVDAELQQITNALSSFQLLDVASQDKVAGLKASLYINYLLKQGTSVTLQAYDLDGERYASLDVNGEADFVDSVKQKAQGRVFKLPNVTYDAMYKTEQDVLVITEDMLN